MYVNLNIIFCAFLHLNNRVVEILWNYQIYKQLFFFSLVRFQTTTGLDSAVDPVQMKNVAFEHVKGVS